MTLPGTSVTNPVWKSLWKLKVPSKVKIFVWRSLHGILPIKCVLANRHIGTTSECPICRSGPEDIRHLLFQCQTAVDLWTALGLISEIEDASREDSSGSGILEVLLRRPDAETTNIGDFRIKETIAIAAWYLEWIRRKRTHDEVSPPLHKCKISILSMVANYAKASKPPDPSAAPKWIRPEPRQVKLNVDASFHVNASAGAVGAILRDYKGHVIGASCKHYPHIASVAMAEALAMKEGLELACRLGCNSILAESDCSNTNLCLHRNGELVE